MPLLAITAGLLLIGCCSKCVRSFVSEFCGGDNDDGDGDDDGDGASRREQNNVLFKTEYWLNKGEVVLFIWCRHSDTAKPKRLFVALTQCP